MTGVQTCALPIYGMIIQGGTPLKGCTVESYQDHRIAMAMEIAGMCASGQTEITGAECVTISFPNFFELLNKKL